MGNHATDSLLASVDFTLIRYSLKVVVVVLNNGGIYGGDRREESTRERVARSLAAAGHGSDPEPTAFAKGCQHQLVMQVSLCLHNSLPLLQRLFPPSPRSIFWS